MDSIQAGKLILNSEVPNSIWKPPSSYFFCPWVYVKSCWQLKDAALEAWTSYFLLFSKPDPLCCMHVSVLSPGQEICFDAIIFITLAPSPYLFFCLCHHWLGCQQLKHFFLNAVPVLALLSYQQQKMSQPLKARPFLPFLIMTPRPFSPFEKCASIKPTFPVAETPLSYILLPLFYT